jgi:hypothetical protein
MVPRVKWRFPREFIPKGESELLETATVDLLGDSEPWNFDAIADAISSPVESQEDWILSGPETPPSSVQYSDGVG